MLYHLHELNRTLLNPLVAWSGAAAQRAVRAGQLAFAHAGHRIASRPATSCSTGSARITRNPRSTSRRSSRTAARRRSSRNARSSKPFCNLLRFKRCSDDPDALKQLRSDPVVLVVAPLSGHHATLLRDTVRTLLRDHEVYITDWVDARMVPLDEGAFHLDDYVAYMRSFIRHIGAAQPARDLGLPADRAGARGGVADGLGAARPTPRTLTHDGRPDRPAQVPDRRSTTSPRPSRCRGSRPT